MLMHWRAELLRPHELRVPRCMVPKGASFASYEFRGFSNASDAAYTTVVCLCTVTATGDHAVRMIPAKTKEGPFEKDFASSTGIMWSSSFNKTDEKNPRRISFSSSSI